MNSSERRPAIASKGLEGLGCPTLRGWEPGSAVGNLAADEISVWVVELDSGLETQAEIDGAEPGPELEALDADERVRAARFVRARDRRRFARCRSALREILGGLLGERPASLRFRTFARGKPELDFLDTGEGRPSLRFNLSHSANLAVIATCHGRELGIDLEQLRPIGEAERIVESFFSANEQAEFAGIASEARALAFVRGWTRKEAILKGLGVGIAGLADRHETGFGTGEMPSQFAPAAPFARVGEWQLWEASPRAGFVATVACQVAGAGGSAGPNEAAENGLESAPPPDSGEDCVH
jgi:4'-phosphopantetheinyl transferase